MIFPEKLTENKYVLCDMRAGAARHLILMGVCLLVLHGCAPVPMDSRRLTPDTPATPTATFPIPTSMPSRTPSPEPTTTPELDFGELTGSLLFEDSFETERGWQLGSTDIGGASLVAGRYSLAVREPHATFIAQAPFEEVDDFILEVKLRLEVCGEGDEYGVMFRMNTAREHFRFALNCEGAARVSRFLETGEAPLLPITQTYATLPGTLVDNRLTIIADGPNLRFFINDIEVFSTRDQALKSGTFGLFVRSRKSGQTSVSFDDFAIYALRSEPTPSATP
jgi:hypothetical protein